MSTCDWRSVERAAEPAWFRLIERIDDGPVVEACHSCGRATLRFFYTPADEDEPGVSGARGGFWVWCPACRRFMHLGSRVPAWWDSDPAVDDEDLEPEPTWLDSHWTDLPISRIIP